jgi:hypothetical protein
MVRKGASLATPEQQSNRITSLRGGVVVVVVVVCAGRRSLFDSFLFLFFGPPTHMCR